MSDLGRSAFSVETTTVWSFPRRGNWATHSSEYRGNFAPQVARNVILRYSKEGDVVLDPMMGGGTTLIEVALLNRRGIGVDISVAAVELARSKLGFKQGDAGEVLIRQGDARDLSWLSDCSIDLILTHPPYANIIRYSKGTVPGDLSNIADIERFCDELEKCIVEFHRVLKTGSICALLIGDIRRHGYYIPLAYLVLERFLRNRFVLKEDVVKIQHNCRSTAAWRKRASAHSFLLIMHEHLFVLRKPTRSEGIPSFGIGAGLPNKD